MTGRSPDLPFATVHGVLVVEQEFGERAGKLGLADAGGAQAETLVEALSNAYLINPVLNAERANLRATDEQVAVAKSGLRAAPAEQLRQTKDRFTSVR